MFPSPVATPPRLVDTSCHPTAMEELDGDEVRLSSRGRYAERDIVQVTPALSLVLPWASDAQPFTDHPPASSRRVVSNRAANFFPLGSLCRFGITWMTRETKC